MVGTIWLCTIYSNANWIFNFSVTNVKDKEMSKLQTILIFNCYLALSNQIRLLTTDSKFVKALQILAAGMALIVFFMILVYEED
jgi:hypothetical protein